MVRRERESLIANERYFQYERRKPEKISENQCLRRKKSFLLNNSTTETN